MTARCFILVVTFAAAGICVDAARRSDIAMPRESLAAVPFRLATWEGRPAQPLDSRVLAALGSDEYIDRVYVAGAGVPVGVFVGYYRSQRQGDTIHSPLNCLPGDGWLPVSHTDIELPAAGRSARVNRYVVEKGTDRQLVLYWYQGRGRFVASEYAAKAYLVWDAIRRGRTDGALVRIITPIAGGTPDAEQQAETRALSFARALVPALRGSLPS